MFLYIYTQEVNIYKSLQEVVLFVLSQTALCVRRSCYCRLIDSNCDNSSSLWSFPVNPHSNLCLVLSYIKPHFSLASELESVLGWCTRAEPCFYTGWFHMMAEDKFSITDSWVITCCSSWREVVTLASMHQQYWHYHWDQITQFIIKLILSGTN